MLRMGQKYSVESLIKGGTDRLKAFFPASLEDYDTRFNDGTDWFVDHWYSGSASHGPPENISIYMGLEDAIKVIPLLQHFELKECLPAAFYFLSQIPEDELIEAVEGGRLSFENLKCCTDGRSYLREAYVHGMEAVLSQKRSAKCTRRDECAAAGRKIINKMLDPYYIVDTDPLRSRWFSRFEYLSKDLCKHCCSRIVDHYDSNRQDVWFDLIEYFDLDL